ncbi:MAG: peroxiredoxin family protein [Cyclobacteriaceae bacterium]|nr:peroxiredoxin family protein [Cyclobacteriaceae bacterium]
MNRLKSIFISTAISIWAFFTYLLIMAIIGGSSILTIIGLLLISALPLGFFSVLLSAKPVARTSKSLTLITSSIVLGAAITLFGVYQGGNFSHLYVAISSLLLWFIYILWYSVLPKSKTDMKLGGHMPTLTFTDIDNNEISNNVYKGKKLLYMFYRGNWCPLCMAQIKEISAQYNELEKRGVEVLLISPQPVSHSAGLAKKMGVNFRFLTDKENKMAQSLNIDQPNGTPLGMEIFGYTSETVLPTVIITDEAGEIIYLDQTDNYRIRPEPSTFLKVLDNLEG